MKKTTQTLHEFARHIHEKEGKLEGGFSVILSVNNAMIIGGTDTNNCNGQNCAAGCGGGQNTVTGCGDPVNSVPGCSGHIGKI